MKLSVGIFLAFFVTSLVIGKMGGKPPAKKKAEPIPKAWYDPAPVRPIRKALQFDDMACGECHSEPLEGNPKDKGEFHDGIELNHAAERRNNLCFNCHNRKNFDAFAGPSGEVIPYKEVAEMCSKCHGPIYRDWKSGAHGRRSGYWDKSQGPQESLQCIACHDPHSPVFKSMKPAGAPPNPYTERGRNGH